MPWLPSVAINLVVFRQAQLELSAVGRRVVLLLHRPVQEFAGCACLGAPPSLREKLGFIAACTLVLSPHPCSVGALPTNDYEEVGWFYGAALLFYLLVSLPLSYIKQSSVDWVNAEELRWVLGAEG